MSTPDPRSGLRKHVAACPPGVKALVASAVLEIESGQVAQPLCDQFTLQLAQGAYRLRMPDSESVDLLSAILGYDVRPFLAPVTVPVKEPGGMAGLTDALDTSSTKSWLLYGSIFFGACWLIWKLKPASKSETRNPLYKKRWKVSPRHDRVLVVS